MSPTPPKLVNSMAWGVSIALSWTWGLGLFFSVQVSLHFGLMGLLAFAIPNMLGLMLFGLLTSRAARRHENPRDFERHFFQTSHSLRYVFLLYQLVAITLTFFAIFRYLFFPIGVDLLLVILLVMGAAVLLGEQFDIRRVKWSHLVMALLIATSMIVLFFGVQSLLDSRGEEWALASGHDSPRSPIFFGYLAAFLCGLLIGPWLDIQQWHRAIQINREKTSIFSSYLFGGMIFFGILLFHGILALVIMSSGGNALLVPSADGLFHAKDAITRYFFVEDFGAGVILKGAYITFITLCIISTLDSGYVSLKWYLRDWVRRSTHLILSLIPKEFFESPMAIMLIAVGVAALSVPLRFELEYFMAFYGSFSIVYAIVFLFRSTSKPEFTNFTHATLFSVAVFSLGLFGVGYFNEYWIFMMLGSLIPLILGFVTISGRVMVDDLQKALPRPDSTDEAPLPSVSGRAAGRAIHALEAAIARLDPKTAEHFHSVIQRVEPTAAQALATVLDSIQPRQGVAAKLIDGELVDDSHIRGHFEGKWFTYSFMATYQDTNSVGNVYFGMYPLYVGKVREMFFEACMPDFDLKKTPFYILTRSFEHKFKAEAREFEVITVRIRVESFNRKFATLEHEIYNGAKTLLGSGRQVLLFVSSETYQIQDMPAEVREAFLPHV